MWFIYIYILHWRLSLLLYCTSIVVEWVVSVCRSRFPQLDWGIFLWVIFGNHQNVFIFYVFTILPNAASSFHDMGLEMLPYWCISLSFSGIQMRRSMAVLLHGWRHSLGKREWRKIISNFLSTWRSKALLSMVALYVHIDWSRYNFQAN